MICGVRRNGINSGKGRNCNRKDVDVHALSVEFELKSTSVCSMTIYKTWFKTTMLQTTFQAHHVINSREYSLAAAYISVTAILTSYTGC